MTYRYQRLPTHPFMPLDGDAPPSPTNASHRPHFRKASKPFDVEGPQGRPRWRWRLKQVKRRYWVLIAVLLTAGIVAAIAAGVVKWKQHSKPSVSIADLKTDVVTWINNDLRGESSPSTDAAILLNQTLSHDDAAHNCSSLSEGLLHSSAINITALFSWLGHLDSSSSTQLYWVHGQGAPQNTCRAISTQGALQNVDCTTQLPALCSSGASVATISHQDTSDKWRITVDSKGQALEGYRDKRSFRFLGVRYADKPTRFSQSTAFQQPGTYDATKAGPVCMQPGSGQMSEDCLFLNIWTPFLPFHGDQSTQLKPVMFWIHGGAFQGDSGTDPTFDGGSLASRGDVVVVTINYRLGNLGFLAINGTSATGNYGFGDMITALDWVHDHIRDFGGDPDKITIAGQSAGAASVRAMLGSPKSTGKFSAAIMQSNLGGYGFAYPYSYYMPLNDYQANFTDSILRQVGCNGRSALPCVQKTSARQLTDVQQAAFIIQDDIYITMPELSLNRTNDIASVPVIMGQMQGDSVFFVDEKPETANLTAAIQDTPWNASVSTHPRQFPITASNNTLIPSVKGNWTDPGSIDAVYNVTVRAGNDAMFRCVDQATAYAAAQNNVTGPLWYYEMQRSYIIYPTRPACNAPVEPGFPNGNPANQTYKCHTGDNIYVFGNVGYANMADRDSQDILFAQLALDSWSSFVRTHDPNPDLAFLRAKGLDATIENMDRVGQWKPVQGSDPAKRLWNTSSIDVGFNELDQCRALNLPLDMYA